MTWKRRNYLLMLQNGVKDTVIVKILTILILNMCNVRNVKSGITMIVWSNKMKISTILSAKIVPRKNNQTKKRKNESNDLFWKNSHFGLVYQFIKFFFIFFTLISLIRDEFQRLIFLMILNLFLYSLISKFRVFLPKSDE